MPVLSSRFSATTVDSVLSNRSRRSSTSTNDDHSFTFETATATAVSLTPLNLLKEKIQPPNNSDLRASKMDQTSSAEPIEEEVPVILDKELEKEYKRKNYTVKEKNLKNRLKNIKLNFKKTFSKIKYLLKSEKSDLASSPFKSYRH